MASRNGRFPAKEAKVSANGADAKTEIAVQTPPITALPRANGRIEDEAPEELNGVSESHSTLETNEQAESGDEESVSSDATEAVRRLRGQVGPPRLEWPVEAERAGDRRKFKQSVAVELLASGKGVTVIARELHVVPSTIYRWLQDPVFLGELEARRDEIIEGLLDHQLLGARVAVVKLIELMESSNEQVALRAAIALQSAGLQAYQLIDVRKRVERIEDNLGMFFSWRK
jgi:transposase-like protein